VPEQACLNGYSNKWLEWQKHPSLLKEGCPEGGVVCYNSHLAKTKQTTPSASLPARRRTALLQQGGEFLLVLALIHNQQTFLFEQPFPTKTLILKLNFAK
jgi:hypothetical protein